VLDGLLEATARTLARLRRFAAPMSSELPPVDIVLSEVLRLLEDAGVAFKIVGGVAVVHHGYPRTTEDVDVLVEKDADARLDAALASHGFERVSERRLTHVPTGVRVDVLVAGTPLPRDGRGVYPSPRELGASPHDARVVDLGGLLELKLRAGRHRDIADVVELLKRVEEARYIELEARFAPALRPQLAELRRDALEEQGEA
jgi:hypothetical protein